MRPLAPLVTLSTGALAGLALAGCAGKAGDDANLVSGKQLFVQRCGSCHILARAGTKGTQGPDLDEAFQRPLRDGFGVDAVEGVVREQIAHPRVGSTMPADLVVGEDAGNVSAYVARVAARPGKDTGLLATAVKPAGSDKPAVAKDGAVELPADPNGQLAYQFTQAMAQPGELTLRMPNESGVPHDIAIDGKGKGDVVEKGVSEFSATFAAGKFTYYCTVPGHAEAGMKGTLTVR